MNSEFSHLEVLLILDRIPYQISFPPTFCYSYNTKFSPADAQEPFQEEQKIPT